MADGINSVFKGLTYIGLHVRKLLFLPEFKGTSISGQIFEKYSNIIFHKIKISPVRKELFHADRQDEAKIRTNTL